MTRRDGGAAPGPSAAAGLLFDCDGTLVVSAEAYQCAWTEALREHGIALGPGWYQARVGLSPDDLVAAAADEHRRTLDLVAVERLAIATYIRLIDTVRANETVAAIARHHAGRIPLAVVSGAPRVAVLASLRATGLLGLFDTVVTVVTVEDAARSKPAPDLYQVALRRIHRAPHQCLAYEDSPEGLTAAVAAGVTAIDIRHRTTP